MAELENLIKMTQFHHRIPRRRNLNLQAYICNQSRQTFILGLLEYSCNLKNSIKPRLSTSDTLS